MLSHILRSTIDYASISQSSAGALVENLMRAQPSYIRTIKPNQNRSSSEYDTKAILHQIKYLGLQENIRVRRAGFAYRNTFEKMVERCVGITSHISLTEHVSCSFYLLSPATSYAGEYIWQGDAQSGCERILKDTGIAKEEWQMGVTKAFIKNPETASCHRFYEVLYVYPTIVVCSRNHAGSILAQHGCTDSTRVP